ncbi:MAG TPA: O-antigen ligase family protein [Candidatus Binatus sp.]|nr:O-antigen ligase family protein [Candidatus Binatus sp.]
MHKLWLPWLILFGLALGCAALLVLGSKIGPIAALAVALLPMLAYFAITRPFIVPYAIYVLLLPFDNVLAFSSGTTLTKFLGIASAGAILLWGIGRRRVLGPSTTLWLCALLVFWMAASLLWAFDVKASMSIIPTYVGLFFLYVVLSVVRVERQDYVILLIAMVVGSIVASMYGIAVFHNQSATDAQALADNLGRMEVKIGDNTIDPNAYSDAILLPFCILLTWGLRSKDLISKAATLAGIVVMLGAVYVSASRGAILAIATAVGYLIIRSRYRFVLLACALVPTILIFVTQSALIDRFNEAQRTGGAGRMGIWSVGMAAFQHHWLIGSGIGNYRALYDTFFIQVYQRYSGGWGRPSHNLIIQVAVEMGVVGLVLVLTFWASNLFALRHIRPNSEWYDYRLALEAATIGIFVAALSIDLLWFKLTWLVFGTVAQLRALTITARARAPALAKVRGGRARPAPRAAPSPTLQPGRVTG